MNLPDDLVIKDAFDLFISYFIIKHAVVIFLYLLMGLDWMFKFYRTAFHRCRYCESRLNFLPLLSELNLDWVRDQVDHATFLIGTFLTQATQVHEFACSYIQFCQRGCEREWLVEGGEVGIVPTSSACHVLTFTCPVSVIQKRVHLLLVLHWVSDGHGWLRFEIRARLAW